MPLGVLALGARRARRLRLAAGRRRRRPGARRAAAPDPKAPRLAPLETRTFSLAPGQELVGETQVLFARYENTFTAIGRRFDVGYEEMRAANPGVDQWLPGEATPVYLPTQSVLPEVPREGIVINVPAMRLYYFTAENGESATPKAPATKVTTHPVGIGAQGWATPIADAKVVQKVRDPVWYVPASVRKEHLGWGEKLPSVVQPGPDNPLGAYALDVVAAELFDPRHEQAGRRRHEVEPWLHSPLPRGYRGAVQPRHERHARADREPARARRLARRRLYLEVHRPLAEDTRDLDAEAERMLASALERAGRAGAIDVDHDAVRKIAAEQRGVPLPVQRGGRSLAEYLAAARIVENDVPYEVDEQVRSVREQARPGAELASGTP